MKIKIAAALIFVLVVAGGLAGVKTMQIKKLIASSKSFAQPPETVSSTIAREEKWQETLTAIGSITAVQGVMITPEISGIVTEIAFEGGAMVNKGDLLVRLDTSAEEAQLRSIESQVELARISLDRERSLRSEKTVSQSELDAAEATFKQNQANADGIRVTIQKKTLRAPFDGHLGVRLVNLGQYLDAGKPIVSLQALKPVFADFSLPQQELAKLKTGMKVRLTTDAYLGHKFEGVLTTINPDLDSVTRSVGLQATFTNAEQLLRPGMFARVEVVLPEEKNVLVVPATSVLSAPFGDSVFLIEPKSGKEGETPGLAVRQQFVRTGRAQGDFIVVEGGLKPGSRIVSTAVFKLRNGMAVVENNTLVPKNETKPQLPDN